jgi:hypothetical protein
VAFVDIPNQLIETTALNSVVFPKDQRIKKVKQIKIQTLLSIVEWGGLLPSSINTNELMPEYLHLQVTLVSL